MAGQVYTNRASKCKQRKKEVTDVHAWYYPARRRTPPQSAKSLGVLEILEELEGEKLGTLRPCSSVPVSLVRIVAHKGGVSAFMPRFVVLWNLVQIPVLVDGHARLGRVAKAERRRGWEFAQEHADAGRRRIRSHVDSEGLVS